MFVTTVNYSGRQTFWCITQENLLEINRDSPGTIILRNIWKIGQICRSQISKTPSESLSRADVFTCLAHENRPIINDVIRKNNTKIAYFCYFEKLSDKLRLIWKSHYSTQ